MKTLLRLLFTLLVPATGFAQPYAVDQYKIAGGGGTSSGGQYAVSGTVGQHDAGGAISGGGYSLTGGFLSFVSVRQTPGAPALTVTHEGNSVTITWPSPSTGFVLEQNSALGAADWMASGFTVSDDGTTRNITIPIPSGSLFFRLKQ